MKTKSIYKTKEGKLEVQQFYEKLLSNIPNPIQRLRIPTRFGETHILKLGNSQGQQIITFHGGNSRYSTGGATDARDKLTDDPPLGYGWSIMDGGPA